MTKSPDDARLEFRQWRQFLVVLTNCTLAVPRSVHLTPASTVLLDPVRGGH